jgi:hypothetical protein
LDFFFLFSCFKKSCGRGKRRGKGKGRKIASGALALEKGKIGPRPKSNLLF